MDYLIKLSLQRIIAPNLISVTKVDQDNIVDMTKIRDIMTAKELTWRMFQR